MGAKDSENEKQPLLKTSLENEPRVPTKNIFLPVGIFFIAVGASLQSTSMHQYVYNYTSSLNVGNNETLSVQKTNISEISCSKNSSSTQSESDKEAANWLLYFELIEYSIGLPVIALAGIYSDFYGRKNFLLLSSLGEAIKYALLFCVVYFKIDLVYALVPYGVNGLTGTFNTFYIAAYTSIADTTEGGKRRSFHMLLVYLFLGLGETAASLGAGFLIHLYGYSIPIAIATGAIVITCVVVSFENETFSEEKRPKKPPFLQTFLRFFSFFRGKGYKEESSTWKFILALTSFLIFLSPLTSSSTIEILYQLGEPFCFSSEMIGYRSATNNAAHMILGTVLVKFFHFCIHDEAIALIGMMSGASYMTIFAFSKSSWMIYLATGTGVLVVVPIAMIKSIMSKFVSSDYQGALFSLIYFLETIDKLVSLTLFLTIYGHTQDLMQGFVFLLMVAFYMVAGVIFLKADPTQAAKKAALVPVAVSNYRDRQRQKCIEINVQEPDVYIEDSTKD